MRGGDADQCDFQRMNGRTGGLFAAGLPGCLQKYGMARMEGGGHGIIDWGMVGGIGPELAQAGLE